MSSHVSVTVFENGPIKISDAATVTFCGRPLQADGDLFLCRCGDSKNAPFCDGSHKESFSDENANPPSKELKLWEGKTVRTFFNPNACMHAFYCKPLNALRTRELEGDEVAAAEIMKVVQSCPSGALSYQTKADLPTPPAPASADVEIMEGGEVRIQCAFDINATLQERQPDVRATLCRCGQSANKPWCDGRHKGRKGFR